MFFKKILIRIGKVLPFLFVFIILIGYIENVYAIAFDITITDIDGETYIYTPISTYISYIVYIDWIDVFLLYIICFALELCWRTFLCVHMILANLVVRCVLEHVYLQYGIVIGLQVFLALWAIYCIYNGARKKFI